MRMAEAEVRAERDRLDLIIDSVADPILVSDNAGKITLMNPPAERLFNARPGSDESAQRRVRTNDAHFSSFISGLLSEGGDVRRRGEMSLTDVVSGTALPVEAIAGKVLSEFGELIAVVTILHDRSEALERSRLYEQVKRASDELEAKVVSATAELARQNELLRRQAVELEQASALKSQFLANMSHEFRTPLNAILGYTSLLLDGVSGALTTGQRKSLERIGSNGRHLVGIISEILDLTRIEAGRMPLQLTRFTLPELIAEVVAEMEPIIARSKLTVSTQVSPKIGPIRSDRQKTKQIVLNLLSNALKFTPKGSVTIRVERGDGQKTVAIAVADTGIGISPADREKIFEDFRQVDSTVARPYGGTGLGLSICRRLARMLGGRIDLESEPGRGSVFTLVVSSSLHK
jgi:signal transduction histidine kinase